MLWIYLFFLVLIVIQVIICMIQRIKIIRMFGVSIPIILVIGLLGSMFIGEIILPFPQYNIKWADNKSLDKILKEEFIKANVKFDKGSFKIIDSQGMDFNHLFLCAYEVDGKEQVRMVHFEKNLFGNMKLKYPIDNKTIINKDGKEDYTYVRDGWLNGYLVTAGFATSQTVLENYHLNYFKIDEISPSGYFMYTELVDEIWKRELGKFFLYLIISSVVTHIRNKKGLQPEAIYSKWRRGDKVFELIYDED